MRQVERGWAQRSGVGVGVQGELQIDQGGWQGTERCRVGVRVQEMLLGGL